MNSKEALEIFYKDVKNYNNDMRKYPAYYLDKPKNEEMLRKWEIKQNEMYATILDDLDVLEIFKKTLSIDDQNLGGFPHTEICVFKNMEDFEKVKAWLKGNKRNKKNKEKLKNDK